MPPTFCRIPLRYIQQKAGVPHKGVSQKIASEFSEIHSCGAQLRRYINKPLNFGANFIDKWFVPQRLGLMNMYQKLLLVERTLFNILDN